MILFSILLIIICCLVIWKTSDGFEVASEYLGRNLNEGVRGATINAIGSSMPELFTTLFFLFVLKDKDGFAGGIGTTAGSAIFNGMIIPAAVIFVVIFKGITKHVEISRKVLFRDGLALIACEIVLIFLIGGDSLNWYHGLVLMALYGIYTAYMLLSMKKNTEEEMEEEDEEDEEEGEKGSLLMNLVTFNFEAIFIKEDINTKNAWTLLLTSMLAIGVACLFLVKSCEWLGDGLGIPIYFIAVILASAATSVPDTVLSIKDAQKGNYDDAVSNALGSNIFDVCFALGLPLFIFTLIYGPIYMSPETVVNISELRILLLILTVCSFLIYVSKKKMGMISAFLLIAIYLVFTAYIMGRAVDSSFTVPISEALFQINDFIDGFRFWTN